MKPLKVIRGERGITLIEVLIALAVMGLVAVAFLVGLTTASRALIIADERTTAGSLARSQMEWVKEQDYDRNDSQSYEQVHVESLIHPGYFISVDADPLHDFEDGIQKITVTIDHQDKEEVITLEGYKVDR